MKKINLYRFGSSLLLLCWLSLGSASPVWKIENNGSTMYLAGTIHFLAESDYPLPAPFEQAYRNSSVVVFETNIEAMQSPETVQKMMRRVTYTDGGNLTQDLSPETYNAVEQFFTLRGVPMTQINGFRPSMVSVMMTLVELQRMGQAGAGVDEHYSQRAVNDLKIRGQLESIDQQIDFLANLGVGQEDDLIRYTLQDLEQLPQVWLAMKNAWRSGDMILLDRIAGQPLREEFPEVYQQILIDRNNAWLPQLDRMLHNKQVELVLVGALHLAGPDGLIELLRKRGYRLKHMQ